MRTDSVLINGGTPIRGQVAIQGSKNASLPILAATLLSKGEVVLHNVPNLVDIRSMLEILEYLGASYTFKNNTVVINGKNVENKEITDEFSNKLRASSLTLGPLLSRFGSCEVGMPGGCAIGVRPLNIHFDGFEALNSSVYVESGIIRAQSDNIHGTFTLEFPSVGATENLIMSSVYSKDVVYLKNVAKEPEVLDLINFLNTCGAKINFEDTSTLKIEGVDELHSSVEYWVQADRIEAGTFLMAAYASKGDITITGVNPNHLSFVLDKLSSMGAKIKTTENSISLAYDGSIDGTSIKTEVYPGFPTDLQPQIGVLLTQANKPSMLVENVFDHRFRYIDELLKMNAHIRTEGKVAYIEPSSLSGCRVEGHDLRGSASMIIAGICASGVTRVIGLKHLYRGYESFIEKLQHLGVDICYI